MSSHMHEWTLVGRLAGFHHSGSPPETHMAISMDEKSRFLTLIFAAAAENRDGDNDTYVQKCMPHCFYHCTVHKHFWLNYTLGCWPEQNIKKLTFWSKQFF